MDHNNERSPPRNSDFRVILEMTEKKNRSVHNSAKQSAISDISDITEVKLYADSGNGNPHSYRQHPQMKSNMNTGQDTSNSFQFQQFGGTNSKSLS